MSISAESRKYLIRTAACLCAAVFCMVIFLVYDQFSHGVRSFYMTFLWLPFLGDGLVQAALAFLSSRFFSPWADRLFHAATAAVTVGFLLRGVFDIAGTGSHYLPVFFVAGALLGGASAGVYLRFRLTEKEELK